MLLFVKQKQSVLYKALYINKYDLKCKHLHVRISVFYSIQEDLHPFSYMPPIFLSLSPYNSYSLFIFCLPPCFPLSLVPGSGSVQPILKAALLRSGNSPWFPIINLCQLWRAHSQRSPSLSLCISSSSSPSRVPVGVEELSIRSVVHGLFGAVCTAHRKLLNPKPILHVPGGYFGPSGQRHAKTTGILEAVCPPTSLPFGAKAHMGLSEIWKKRFVPWSC